MFKKYMDFFKSEDGRKMIEAAFPAADYYRADVTVYISNFKMIHTDPFTGCISFPINGVFVVLGNNSRNYK